MKNRFELEKQKALNQKLDSIKKKVIKNGISQRNVNNNRKRIKEEMENTRKKAKS